MTTKEIIKDFISNDLLQGAQDTPLDDEVQLIDSGIIDSLRIMTLLVFLEEKFSLQIPGEDLLPENFASITTIADFVDRQLSR